MITKKQWVTVIDKLRELRRRGYHPTFFGFEIYAAYVNEIIILDSARKPELGEQYPVCPVRGSGLWLVDHSSLTKRSLGFQDVLDQIALTVRFSDLKQFDDLITKEYPSDANQRERTL